MGASEALVFGVIAMVLALPLSLIVFFKMKKKWLGCILLPISWIVSFIIIALVISAVHSCIKEYNVSKAMVGVRLLEEDTNWRFETTWLMKPDGTFYCEYDKGSNDHSVEPCGNDNYSDKGTFTRVDSVYAIKANVTPSLVIYFDMENQLVTPVYDNDTLEVIKADWNSIREYFKKP